MRNNKSINTHVYDVNIIISTVFESTIAIRLFPNRDTKITIVQYNNIIYCNNIIVNTFLKY